MTDVRVLAKSIVPRSANHVQEDEDEPIWSAKGEICTAVAVERGFQRSASGDCDAHGLLRRASHRQFAT